MKNVPKDFTAVKGHFHILVQREHTEVLPPGRVSMTAALVKVDITVKALAMKPQQVFEINAEPMYHTSF